MEACPKCREGMGVTIESRVRPDGTRRRRLQCSTCGHRWSTAEPGAAPPRPQEKRAPGKKPRALGEQDVIAILLADSSNLNELAAFYGVSREAIRQTRYGRIHGKVAPEIPRQTPRPSTRGLRVCTKCIHWLSRCTIGFPDPAELGIGFAKECQAYERL